MPSKMTLAILLAICSQGALAQEYPEGGYLFSSSHAAPMDIQSEEVEGLIDGRSARVTLKKDSGPVARLLVELEMSGGAFGHVEIPLHKLPMLDLSSSYISGDIEDQFVTIVIRFGEGNRCFTNDDGRSRIILTFYASEPADAVLRSYSNCGGIDEQVLLMDR